MINLLYLDFQT